MPIAGAVSALAGQLWLGGSDSLPAIMAEAAAVGAILALVVHEMIPEAVHEGGSSIALPLLASFFFTLLAAAYV
jgi:zinc transporter ZupT